MPRQLVPVLVAVCLGLAALADDHPTKVLTNAIKNTVKPSNCRYAVQVHGGRAQGASHRIIDANVNQRYRVESLGKLERVLEPFPAFLVPGSLGGAIQLEGSWAPILSNDEGRQMVKLLKPLIVVLAELKGLRRRVEWATDSSSDEQDAPDGQPSDGSTDSGEPPSRSLVVEATHDMALEHLADIATSGSFKEG